MKIQKKISNHFKEVLKTKKTPHAVATGFAIGTFIAILPTPGFGFILGILITLIFKRVSKYSLFAALIIWNPIIQIPFTFISYWIGDFLLKPLSVIELEIQGFTKIYHITKRFLLGSIIIGFIMSLISYTTVFIIWRKIVRK